MNLKKIGKVFASKFVGTGPSSYKKRICWAAVPQRLRNTGVNYTKRLLWYILWCYNCAFVGHNKK